MSRTLVKIAGKQIIDADTTGAFEQQVFRDSYAEFLLQSQVYNPGEKYRTFAEMVHHQPKASSLHYKVGFSIGLYVNELGKRIPGCYDTLGMIQLPFASHRFQILASDIKAQAAHQVAIIYFTDTLILYKVIGAFLLLGFKHDSIDVQEGMPDTFMLQPGPGLSICAYREV